MEIHTAVKTEGFVAAGITKLLIILSAVLLVMYLLKNPNVAAAAVTRGLKLFCQKLLPALFPMAVIGSVFSQMGDTLPMPTGLLSKIFGIGKNSVCALVFGLFAGFPIGAIMIGDGYRSGLIDRDEAEFMLGVVSNAGAAFVIGGVGSSLFENTKLGVMLYIIQLLLSLAALLVRRVIRRGRGEANASVPTDTRQPKLTELVTVGVGSAVKGMLSVCGYVVFFSVLTDFITRLLEKASDAPVLNAVVMGAFEIGSGMQAAASLGGRAGTLLAAAFVGWSGLCVAMQVSAASGVGMRKYLALRALFTLLMPIAAAAVMKIANIC